ncbi:unnamed protein product, partial [marine sediment metagenome]
YNQFIEIRYSEISPKVDGKIEEIWDTADSVTEFIQYRPYEGIEPMESTVVYILQDDQNLFVAFKCYCKKEMPVALLGGNEDYVALYLDTFGSKRLAYYFRVTASGMRTDGITFDDGRSHDDSWDGIWYSATTCYDDKYEVEMKIPFKSLRCKKDLSEWGVNLKRMIAVNQEHNYWILVTEEEGFRVSKFGLLRNIKVKHGAYYFELYPEGFIRYNRLPNKVTQVKPNFSLNVKWDLTQETTVNATILPDFSQIESDPFILNLSRYPIYLEERRPFFLEGKDIFRMSDYGSGSGFYKALEIFYSRKIGKSLNNVDLVPILGGLKFVHKSTDWNIGFLSALTDSINTELKILIILQYIYYSRFHW